MKRRILISNDDGIYSPGILALAKVASRLGEVRIVAPDVEQSSMSHAITSSRPLRYKRIRLGDFEAYRVNGTPADCVALGAHRWGHVDLVLSGINLGLNLGNSCWHSGTLAAAKQAALLGLRGIAISAPVTDSREPNFIFWFTITPLEGAEEGTDRWAIEHNWVSITPLRLDLTDEKDLSRALSLAQTPPVSAAKKG